MYISFWKISLVRSLMNINTGSKFYPTVKVASTADSHTYLSVVQHTVPPVPALTYWFLCIQTESNRFLLSSLARCISSIFADSWCQNDTVVIVVKSSNQFEICETITSNPGTRSFARNLRKIAKRRPRQASGNVQGDARSKVEADN